MNFPYTSISQGYEYVNLAVSYVFNRVKVTFIIIMIMTMILMRIMLMMALLMIVMNLLLEINRKETNISVCACCMRERENVEKIYNAYAAPVMVIVTGQFRNDVNLSYYGRLMANMPDLILLIMNVFVFLLISWTPENDMN